ncbi:MAG: STAS domain-containing protein [Fibromonadaceae bacterium]|jgi:anti-anti-sigma factor|nr:STAS domain-containing protein [Fibromonadaceae bacterium]
MAECVIEEKNGYFQINNFNLETDDLYHIFEKIEDSLKIKKQDVLLSLKKIRVLYSSHLATLVRIHQMMHKSNLRFVISDISPEIRNLMQITQLDSIFSIYETTEDFTKNLKSEEVQQLKNDFEWHMEKQEEDVAKVLCEGNMLAGEQLDQLRNGIEDFYSIVFDFSKLQSIDSASVAFLDKLTDSHTVSVAGANPELVEQFRQKLLYGKIKLL